MSWLKNPCCLHVWMQKEFDSKIIQAHYHHYEINIDIRVVESTAGYLFNRSNRLISHSHVHKMINWDLKKLNLDLKMLNFYYNLYENLKKL